jgi:hypothetical protein
MNNIQQISIGMQKDAPYLMKVTEDLPSMDTLTLIIGSMFDSIAAEDHLAIAPTALYILYSMSFVPQVASAILHHQVQIFPPPPLHLLLTLLFLFFFFFFAGQRPTPPPNVPVPVATAAEQLYQLNLIGSERNPRTGR